MYRPEGIDYSKAEELMLVKDSYEWSLVEAGADAMLEGLKRETSEPQYWDAGKQVGWVVFIPEEEE